MERGHDSFQATDRDVASPIFYAGGSERRRRSIYPSSESVDRLAVRYVAQVLDNGLVDPELEEMDSAIGEHRVEASRVRRAEAVGRFGTGAGPGQVRLRCDVAVGDRVVP